jgi:hypothetical protein
LLASSVCDTSKHVHDVHKQQPASQPAREREAEKSDDGERKKEKKCNKNQKETIKNSRSSVWHLIFGRLQSRKKKNFRQLDMARSGAIRMVIEGERLTFQKSQPGAMCCAKHIF